MINCKTHATKQGYMPITKDTYVAKNVSLQDAHKQGRIHLVKKK